MLKMSPFNFERLKIHSFSLIEIIDLFMLEVYKQEM